MESWGGEEQDSEVGVELNEGEKRSVSEKRDCGKKVDQVLWSGKEGKDMITSGPPVSVSKAPAALNSRTYMSWVWLFVISELSWARWPSD